MQPAEAAASGSLAQPQWICYLLLHHLIGPRPDPAASQTHKPPKWSPTSSPACCRISLCSPLPTRATPLQCMGPPWVCHPWGCLCPDPSTALHICTCPLFTFALQGTVSVSNRLLAAASAQVHPTCSQTLVPTLPPAHIPCSPCSH